MNQATRVILVRHGQSTYNALGLYQGNCNDSILTEKGHLAASQTGLVLQNIVVDAVYSSPLERALETTKDILAKIDPNQKLPIQTHSHLEEIHLPNWQGLSYKYVREEYAADYQVWSESPHKVYFDLPETEENDRATISIKTRFYPLDNFYEKARQFWTEIIPYHAGKTILIVSHGGTIRALLSTALGIELKYYHFIQQSNCGISILDFPESSPNSASLKALNQTKHLGEILPKLKAGKDGLRLLLLPTDKKYSTDEDLKLEQIFQSISIDFCFNISEPHSQQIAQKILAERSPNIFQIQSSQPNFLSVWQETIFANKKREEGLMTGLAIVDRTILEANLQEIIGLTLDRSSLQLKSNTLSFIYYSKICNHPILQAINF